MADATLASPPDSPTLNIPRYRFLNLNCTILGDPNPNHIFSVRTSSHEITDGLKERVKSLLNPFYQTTPFFCFELWKVNIPIDGTFQEKMQSFEAQEEHRLLPCDKVSALWPEEVEGRMLHLIAKPPSLKTLGSGQCFEFQNFHLNVVVAHCDDSPVDPNNMITMQYCKEATVGTLRYTIKEMFKPLFDDIPFAHLRIWKVNLPIDESLGQALKDFPFDEKRQTSFVDFEKPVGDIFVNGFDTGKLHFVIKGPRSSCPCKKQTVGGKSSDDIRSLSKFRRLKRHAATTGVSGLAKAGKPGVLVFQGSKPSISSFLEAARSLRYLDFHHVNTQPLPKEHHDVWIGSAPSPGLEEVPDMKALIEAMEKIDRKSWFRKEMGMEKRDG